MTSCKEGGELTVLCANNYLVQFIITQNGFQQAKQMVLEERVSSANILSMYKLDQNLFGIFDTRGSLRFVSLEDPELVKFKTKYDSTEMEEVLPVLQHSERQALMRESEF